MTIAALATAGTSFCAAVPIGDGAFQSPRSRVPNPDNWPAVPFLHALALSPVDASLAALLPGPRRADPLLLASAAVGSGLGLQMFADALLGGGNVPRLCLRARHPRGRPRPLLRIARQSGGRAVIGQAAVLLASCLVLWGEGTGLT